VKEVAANRRSNVAINHAANGIVDEPTQPRSWICRVRDCGYHQAGGSELKLIEDQNNSYVIGPKES
jgi:hypothetical protein